MSASSSDHDLIRNILLATDLSARGDRALGRAVALAAECHANLIVVHAFEEFSESSLTYDRHPQPSWRAPADAANIAKLRIREALEVDLGGVLERASILIEEGEPAEVIERTSASARSDLIVTGIAREGLFASRPVILGRTVERLLRRISIPLLIVRNRPRTRYRHVLVTTDFSEPSAHALQVALSFFPDPPLHLLHAFEIPGAGALDDLNRHVESFRQTRAVDLQQFLSSMVLPPEARQRLVTHIELGHPAQLVREYVRDHGADLVVLGTRGRGALLEAIVGSTAKSILAALPCDALVVRAPDGRMPRES